MFNYKGPNQGGIYRRRSRSATRAANNLGIVDQTKLLQGVRKFRSDKLETLDAYYERRQYESKCEWDQYEGVNGEYIPVRQRAPRFNFGYAKNLSQRLAAKLLGKSVFPTFTIDEFPEEQAFFAAVVREAKLSSRLLEPCRRLVNTSSVFIRFYIEEGAYKIEWYHSKYCYPLFQGNGELESVRVQYVYEDKDDKDQKGNPKKKWYRIDLGTMTETLFDNPEYQAGAEPVFTPVAEVDHGLGFVQGEWFRTCELPNSPDGYSITEDILDFIDELNYSLSQSSQAVSYNQDPQLLITGMTEDEMEDLVKSSTKSWNMGRQGQASYLEADLSGVEKAMELRERVRQNISEISRVVLLDPEKIVGSAQSAKAMEVLHGPMKDLIDELREPVGESVKKLVLKMGLATIILERQGMAVPILLPKGWAPQSIDLVTKWPPIFQQTMEDLQKKIQVATAASAGNIVSRRTATKFVQEDFGIEDLELELQIVDTQKNLNPFGGF